MENVLEGYVSNVREFMGKTPCKHRNAQFISYVVRGTVPVTRIHQYLKASDSKMASFGMPTGPKSDIAELMYVAALHQTSFPELRIDGSLSASDIVLYLRSRYGIKIDDGTASDIVKGLGGTCGQRLARICEDSSGMLSGHSDVSKDSQHLSHGSEESPNSINNQEETIDENFLDMVQWVSTLLIPSVIRSTDASCHSAELNARVRKIVQELRTVEDTSGGSMMQFIRRIISRRFWQQELQKVKSEQPFDPSCV